VTVRELDRLITKTDLDPLSKHTLRAVRKAVISGRSGSPEVGENFWYVSIDSSGGAPMRMSFRIRKPTNE
jgi:hypothetical protein